MVKTTTLGASAEERIVVEKVLSEEPKLDVPDDGLVLGYASAFGRAQCVLKRGDVRNVEMPGSRLKDESISEVLRMGSRRAIALAQAGR